MIPKTWIRQFSLRGLSLRQRLPILICLLLVTVMIGFTLVSYYSVRRVTLKSASERLADVSEQVTGMFGQSAQGQIFAYRAFAIRTDVKEFLRTRSEDLKSSVLSSMQRLTADTLLVLMQLTDLDYNPLLVHTNGSLEQMLDADSLTRMAVMEDSSVIGKFHQVRGTMFHSIKTPIVDTTVRGYLVGWRKVSATPATLERFNKLLGENAKIFVGNEDRSAWTDLSGPATDPLPADIEFSDPRLSYRNPSGEVVLAGVKSIPNTPWIFVVEFPKKQIVDPANAFLKWMIILGALINVIAIFVTWYMSRNLTRPLQQLTEAATNIAGGQHHHKVSVNRYDEIGKLSRAFNSMANKVSRSKEELELKVEETQNMTKRLRELSAHLQNIREEERIHIAREMHDELGQLLTGFKMDVSWLHKKIGSSEDPVIKEKLEEMMDVVNEAARFVRKLASELRPSILDDLGLVPALDWHSQEFKRRSNINVEFRTSLEDINTSKDVATGIFRIYQESLTNVARHADAHKVVSELEVSDNNIRLTITDDGKGFDARTSERKTLGILGMKERAAMLGGRLKIYSAPGKGTTVLITVPQHHGAYSTAS
jgi:signal transduction histidine kinase